MYKGIKTFVQSWDTCQKNKRDSMETKGLLFPLPIRDKVWEEILMDVVEGLLRREGKSVVFVVVDRLSKFTHFIAKSHSYTTQQVAKVFFHHIFHL